MLMFSILIGVVIYFYTDSKYFLEKIVQDFKILIVYTYRSFLPYHHLNLTYFFPLFLLKVYVNVIAATEEQIADWI